MADSNIAGRDRDDLPLSPRQREILALVAEGHSTAGIADELGISPGTVKVHLTSTYRKLGVRNRVQAARYYLDHLAPMEVPGTRASREHD
jgi:DNA-binding CsgD family transcriptional regulator